MGKSNYRCEPSPVAVHHSLLTTHHSPLTIAPDWAERLLVLALYGLLVARLLGKYLADGGIVNLLLLPSEGIVVVFLLVRRPAATISRRPADWLLALAATISPMLVNTGIGEPLIPITAAAFLLIMGLVVQVWAKLTLGRSLGLVPAHRGLKLSGPYRYVRHPMYAGYLLSHLAYLLVNPTWWNLAVYGLCYGLQFPRLLTEERLLRRDPGYRAYESAVRSRLIPGVL
jgi:protein-S-isoprenylcysteine O-methyltransferase Ste14